MFDDAAATELELFVDNDADLYRQQGLPILRNLANKKAKGIFDTGKAVKLYMYLMDNGAKKYAREFGGTCNTMFSPETRRHVAMQFVKHFEEEYKHGAYDNLLTKASLARKMGGPVRRRRARR